MRKLVLLIPLSLALFCSLVQGQILAPILQGAPAGGGTMTCGQTDFSSGSQSNLANYILWTPCKTGANGAGYTLTTLQVYYSTIGTSKQFYTALYTDKTSSCPLSQGHCPNTPVCDDATGVTLTLINSLNTDTPTGCGTLSANTIYWIETVVNDAAPGVGKGTSTACSNAVGFNSSYYVLGTAGTWPNPATGLSTGATCYTIQALLTGN